MIARPLRRPARSPRPAGWPRPRAARHALASLARSTPRIAWRMLLDDRRALPAKWAVLALLVLAAALLELPL